MNNDQSQAQNYRPRSPNLSGLQAPPPPRLNRLPSIPNSAESNFPQSTSFQYSGSYETTPQHLQSPASSRIVQPNYIGTQIYQSPFASHGPQHQFSDYNPFQPVHDDMARLRSRPQVNYSDDAYPSNEFDERIAIPAQRVPPQPQTIMTEFPPQNAFQQSFPQSQPLAPMPMPVPVQSQTQGQHESSARGMPQQSSLLPDIDVKTKFPVARIKRIMQTDEDIGKVAQATPTAVAKALELFMIALVSKGASNAKDQGSKRVTATHLKNALLADPQFDFLNEICGSVPDESAKKSRAKSEAKSESDDEDITGTTTAKKRKGGKRKKAAGDDSD